MIAMRKQKASKPDVAVFVRFANQRERDYVNAGVAAAEKRVQKAAPGAALSFQAFAHSALMDKARAELDGKTFEDWGKTR